MNPTPLKKFSMLFFFSVMFCILALPGKARAEAETNSVTKRPAIMERIQNLRAKIMDRRTEIKTKAEEKREEVKANASERREKIETQITERRAALKQRIENRHKEIITKHIKQIYNRLVQAIKKLEASAERVKAHIEKLSAAGHEVTEMRTFLAVANGTIAEAKTAVEAFQSSLQNAKDAATREAAMTAIRNATNTAKEKIKTAHQALVAVINSIKKSQ